MCVGGGGGARGGLSRFTIHNNEIDILACAFGHKKRRKGKREGKGEYCVHKSRNKERFKSLLRRRGTNFHKVPTLYR